MVLNLKILNMINVIGFMQGRLSPIIEGKIQAFPSLFWEQEFEIAEKLKFNLMEWTLDHNNLYENPLLTPDGRDKVLMLMKKHSIKIMSITGDCFMQRPFWKESKDSSAFEILKGDFLKIVDACSKTKINFIVVPLVDNSSIRRLNQETCVIDFFLNHSDFLLKKNVKIIFESDYSPKKLSEFISKFDEDLFGINYDIGNSASLGYDPKEEFGEYGNRIMNVHVKDRKFNGNTVPLGEGSANFTSIFEELSVLNYRGNFILQTSRSNNNDHLTPLIKYRDFINKFVRNYLK